MRETRGTTQLKSTIRRQVCSYLYRNRNVSKQEIAGALKVSLPTVSQHLNELAAQGLVSVSGTLASTGGRKASAYSLIPDARAAVGIDITRRHIGLVVVDLYGEILSHLRIRQDFENTKHYYRILGELSEEAVKTAGILPADILGTGIAVPAIISNDQKKLNYSTALGMEGGDLSEFAQDIRFRSTFHNDANAAGFAETWNAETDNTIAYLSLNFTIGGALIMNRSIYEGQNRRGGEFGHMTIVPHGKPCYCGKQGCADAYLSAHILTEAVNGSLDDFFAGLQKGDENCTAVWEQYLEHLCVTVNNIRMMFDCDVVLGGYVGSCIEPYLAEIRRRAAVRDPFGSSGGYLRACRYRTEATAVGAALSFVDCFLREV